MTLVFLLKLIKKRKTNPNGLIYVDKLSQRVKRAQMFTFKFELSSPKVIQKFGIKSVESKVLNQNI